MAIPKLIVNLFVFITFLAAGPAYGVELSEDQAFNLQVKLIDQQSIELYWQIAPNHYLYKNQLALVNSKNVPLLAEENLPPATIIKDPVLGEYAVYSDELVVTVPWHKSFANKKLLLRYQGCAKDGFCYLPINKLLTISGDHISVENTDLQQFPVTYSASNLADMLEDRFLPITLLIFFCLGVILSFTPCVLPMIPIVVNLIVGPKKISSRKAFALSSSYVIGMAACYTVAGVIAGILGATLQAWLQQPAVLITLSTLLVVLALAQFELIHISLPHFNKRLHNWSAQQLQGSYIGAFILGILSALIISPCITPPLIGALTYISQHGNPVVGGLALLSLGLGMGVPLIVVAMLSSMILPKAGEWMNVVKNCAGLTLLGLAIWLMQRIIPDYIAVMLWGALCIVAAFLFKAFNLSAHSKTSTKILKSLGIILAILGGSLILNTLYMHYMHTPQLAQQSLQWHNIDTIKDLEKSLAEASKKHQYTLLEFHAFWCTSCKRIEATVLNNPEVVARLKAFNLLRVDMTDMDPKQKELLNLLKVYGPPVLVFFNPSGAEIKDKRVIGEINTQDMLQLLAGLAG